LNEEFRDAAIYGDFDKVKAFIAKDSSYITATDEYGFTVLHDIVAEHSLDMVSLFIDSGANVNAQNDDGIAPLHLVAYSYIAKVLLEAGADIEIKALDGATPLLLKAEHPEGYEIMEFLLEVGANVFSKTDQGQTAMSIAVSREEQEKINLIKRYEKKT